MNNWNPNESCELLIFIVPCGKAESILDYLHDHHDSGATIMYGKGTRPGRLLDLLGLSEIRREILLSVNPASKCLDIGREIRKEFHLDRKGEGIAFTIPLQQVIGTHHLELSERPAEEAPVKECKYVALCCILDAGQSDEAIEVANRAGAAGATVLKAKGLAELDPQLYGFEIEAEKDLILMVLPQKNLPDVEEALFKEFELHRENKGILYSYPLSHVIGLFGQEE